MKATVTPEELARRLNIFRCKLYNILDFIKNQGVEINYCASRQSFYYVRNVHFYFGFSFDKIHLRSIVGGRLNIFLDFFVSPELLDLEELHL